MTATATRRSAHATTCSRSRSSTPGWTASPMVSTSTGPPPTPTSPLRPSRQPSTSRSWWATRRCASRRSDGTTCPPTRSRSSGCVGPPRESMEEGAFGISSGLDYPPGRSRPPRSWRRWRARRPVSEASTTRTCATPWATASSTRSGRRSRSAGWVAARPTSPILPARLPRAGGGDARPRRQARADRAGCHVGYLPL